MKNTLTLYSILVGLLAMQSCDKDFGELNLNPDGVTQIDPGTLFSQTLVQYSAVDMEPRTNYFHAFMQYGFDGSWAGTNYELSDPISSRYWNSIYGGVIRDLEYVIDFQLQEDPEYVNTYAAARIWRVFIYQKLTDIYGDIPFTEAGDAFEREFTPVYDRQEEIYATLITELREAVDLFDVNARQVEGDQFFGDVEVAEQITKWQRFANSILLRIGMRHLKVDPTTAANLVNEAINGGVMQSLDDMPVLTHDGIASGFEFNLQDNHFALHHTLVEAMKRTGDPRLNIYGAIHSEAGANGSIISTDTTEYQGYIFGEATDTITVLVSFPVFRPANAPFFDFHYAQVEFLQAEAVLRGFVSGDANVHYEAGIRAHMQSLSQLLTNPEVTAAEIAAYLTANPLAGTVEEQIERVNTEFWVSCFLYDADEAWANWRRTGYPALVPNPETVNSATTTDSPGRIPRKLPYPLDEFNFNSDEFIKALSAYGNQNDFNVQSRVWWDVE